MQLTMAELKELITASQPCHQSTEWKELGWRIVVLQRGWVVVGSVSQLQDEIKIEDASVIRTWGTTKGIGELALSGPTPNTRLDACGTCRAHLAGVVFQIESERAKWKQ